MYVDPPYYKQGKRLYRYHYAKYQHLLLSRVLREAKVPWLLSYDDCDEVRALYAGLEMREVGIGYSAKERKLGGEVLVSSSDVNWPRINNQIGKRREWITDGVRAGDGTID
jgi:DNA adenine methylase